MVTKRIFQIGFGRCGTTSLYRFFRDNGVPSIHHDKNQLAHNFVRRMEADEDPFVDYPDIVFFSDMGCSNGAFLEPFRDFRYMLEFYPDAYFILNVRDRQRWLLSRSNHFKLLRWQGESRGLPTSGDVIAQWGRDWDEHLGDVRGFFANRPDQLLEFDIEKDDPQRLVDFLAADFLLDAKHYRQSNRSSPARSRYVLEGGRVVKVRAKPAPASSA